MFSLMQLLVCAQHGNQAADTFLSRFRFMGSGDAIEDGVTVGAVELVKECLRLRVCVQCLLQVVRYGDAAL